ncbi:MAG: HepT-like ribonuclease domain-containing protein [Salinivirgaceae bacterium]
MKEKGQKYLSDIIQAIDLIEDFTKSVTSYNDFVIDLKTQSAVERQLGIIGEAVSKLNKHHPEILLEHSKLIIGFRNRLIHAYDAVDSSMIWAIIKKHLNTLKEEANKNLSNN